MNPMTVPTTRRTLLIFLLSCSIWLAPTVLLLTPLTPSAQTPAPPTGGYPSASRLQEVYARGQSAGYGSFKAESNFGQGPVPGSMDYQLESALKNQGSDLSPAEREVFTSGFRKGADNAAGGMFQIDPSQIHVQGMDTSSTTTITGKTPTAEPGTLQLTDEKGNTYFVDVDANGNYKKIVPQADFQPVKATLWTKNGKLVRTVKADGTWAPISSAHVTPSAQQLDQAVALVDPCERALLVASSEPDRSVSRSGPDTTSPNSTLLRVRFFGGNGFTPRAPQSHVRLVGDPLPPEVVDQMNTLGKDIADYEHQKETLEKELRENKDAKTGKPLNRNEFKQKETELDNVKNKLKSAEKNQQFISDDARKVAEDAYKARKAQYALPEQIRRLRASGDPASLQRADMMEHQLQALNQFYGPIASVPIVPSGQSGFALLSAPGSTTNLSSEPSMKGHMNLVATEQIKTSTDAQVQLESVAHVEEEDSNPTATMYAYVGYDPMKGIRINPNWAIGPTWTDSDAKPPVVAPIDGKGDFTITGLTNRSKPCLTLHATYRFDHVSTPINRDQVGYVANVTMNGNRSWTAAFQSDVDIKAVKDSYMDEGAINGVPYNWAIWRTPFSEAPVIANGQISDGGYNRLSWEPPFKNVMVYGEWNPGVNPDPVPGLHPEDWPHTQADPQPVFIVPGSWLED